MSFDRIVGIEGGFQNKAAVERALNYCKEACARGPPFTEYNNWKT